ncbi:MAG: hypothetical protein Q9213_008071, partial [Squamulea squamosa]
MAPAKRRRPGNWQSNDGEDLQDGSNDVNGNGSVPQKHVTDTPFSIDMFHQMSPHPYDDPTLPPKMNTVVHIRPQAIWASLNKYSNFVIRDHKYAVHRYALITRFQPLPKLHSPLDSDAEVACPARILEIRALDAKNVYIRLYWLYTPEQLSNGRQPYHGKDELIATNHMEIVDAARVIEPHAIVHWKDEKKELPEILVDCKNYWRQTYHILSQELSPPKTHCTCNRPINPDHISVRCTSQQCSLLMHGKCIEEATVAKLRLQQQQATPIPTPQVPSRVKHHGLNHEPVEAATDFTVEVIISKRPDVQGRKRLACQDVHVGR